MNTRKVAIIPPEEFAKLKYHDAPERAVGLPAISSTMKHISEEMGIIDGLKVLNKMNQHGGFDCPGCAWPDPDYHRSALGEYCENGAKAIAEEATKKRADANFFRQHSVEEMSCWSDFQIGKSGRITEPLYLAKDSSHYQPIAWDEAFTKIGNKLQSLSSPDEAAFYTSGRTSNEAAFMYQLFAREFGTNNLPDCSNMCHESSGTGLSKTLGIGKGSVTLEDIYQSDLVVVIGQNPGTNHPRMLAALEKCKQNGGSIVTINPINEAGTNVFIDPQNPLKILKGGTKLEDLYLQVKINGDVALLKAALLLMLKAEEDRPGTVFDHEFIERKCENYQELINHLHESDYGTCVLESGLTDVQVRKFADYLIQKKKIIFCWAMGLTQHENGVENVQEIVNILLLKGSIGKPGAGTCPVRGHSNVQGDRTMGIWEKPKEDFLTKLDERFNIKSPRSHGYDVVDAIRAMDSEKIKVFISMGGNFISATPDSQFTGAAMKKCELTIQISTKLNRSHLVTGEEAIILPCLSRSEADEQNGKQQFVTTENSMGVVQQSLGSFDPASSALKSEPAIVAGLALASLPQSKTNWQEMISNYDIIRTHIEAVIPGFNDYNQRVRKKGGFYLPNGSRNGEFNTESQKAIFTVNPLPKNDIDPDHFILMTIRSHDQFNTTIYGMHDRYRGIHNERRVVLMNPSDLDNHGFEKGQVIHLTGHYGKETREARNFKIIPYNIAKGCLGAYFPETNVLVPINHVARESNTPVSKFVEVSVHT
ncbi:oxidoreductase alpha (molybdopterin) subunit [Reichenbachiella faecimaris]|uniref:Oxidoreductase alpha (Molybdopterin) subunit n=1 Tax=Reichenbachiella faecimaris TaxID=692418 RepID=A0A1W2GN76_REIFA|nr:FdhF/YdeP family oxidoreductase [Reichenbachiella faecimaris]SMD38097.1 oxidoreductase alpha (molybdopterin) subunit [Reichenbachiella faecimaris]